VDIVTVLLNAGADLRASDIHGHTPLMVAVTWSYPSVVRRLLEAGADPTATDNDGKTALNQLHGEYETAIAELHKQAGARQ